MQQRLLLALFSLEVIFYPFIIGLRNIKDTSELGPEDLLSRETFLGTGIATMFLWVPIALVIGLALGRRLRNHPEIIVFFHERELSPDEIPPTVGIFAPLCVVAVVVVIYGALICLKLFFITVPVYLIFRLWKKKGIRSLLAWIMKLVVRIAIRLKRMSYVGYILPVVFGFIFARGLSRGKESTAGASYALILMQMVVLIALWKHIRNPDTRSSPASLPPSQEPLPGHPPPGRTLPGHPLQVPPFPSLPQEPHTVSPHQSLQQPYRQQAAPPRPPLHQSPPPPEPLSPGQFQQSRPQHLPFPGARPPQQPNPEEPASGPPGSPGDQKRPRWFGRGKKDA